MAAALPAADRAEVAPDRFSTPPDSTLVKAE
jgi:hypothetical protein